MCATDLVPSVHSITVFRDAVSNLLIKTVFLVSKVQEFLIYFFFGVHI